MQSLPMATPTEWLTKMLDLKKGQIVRYNGKGPLRGAFAEVDQRTSKARFRIIMTREDGSRFGVTASLDQLEAV